MKISDKAKIIAFLLASFFSAIQSNAQCTVNVLQDDECNNNGIIEIIPDPTFSAPFTLDVIFPTGENFNTVFATDTFLLDDLGGGTYDITITAGANTCNIQQTLSEVIFNSSQFTPSISFNGYNVSCNGSCDGSIQVNIFPSPETYTIDFYEDSVFGAPFYSIAANSASQNGLCAGEYFILFTSSTGCEIVRSVTLREPDVLSVDETITNILCNSQFDGDIQIDVSGGVGPKINNSTGAVVDTLDYTFSWTGPNGFTSTSEDLSSIEGGTYNLEVSDANGCLYSATYDVIDNIPPVELSVLTSDSVRCFGQNTGSVEVLAIGGTPGYDYRINSSAWQASPVFENLSAGTYFLEARDVNGCIDTLSHEVFEYPLLGLELLSLDTIFCVNSLGSFEIVGTGGLPAYEYNLAGDVQNIGLYDDLDEGSYFLSITDAYSCQFDTLITIEEIDFLSVSSDISDLTCFNSADGSISVSASLGTSPYTIDVDGIVPSFSSADSNHYSNLSVGFYDISVTDAKGCPFTSTVQVTEPTQIVLAVQSTTTPSCFGLSDGSISLFSSGGQGNLVYTWLKDGAPFAGATNTQLNISAGSYAVFATDIAGCNSDTLTVNISQPDLLVLTTDSSSNPNCFEGSDGFIAVSGSGGTTPYNYAWTGSSSSTNNYINNLEQGAYQVTITDSRNCTDNLIFLLAHPSQMSFVTNTIDVNCFGESTGQISVDVSGGTLPYLSITHNPSSVGVVSSTASNNLTVNQLPSGSYIVTATDANSCSISDTLAIDQNTEISASFSNVVSETCNSANAEATIAPSGGVPGYTYQWLATGQTTSVATQLSSGNTLVTVTDQLTCQKTFNVFIPKITEVEIQSVTVTDNLCFGGSDGELEVKAIGEALPFTFTLTGIPGSFVSSDTITVIDNLPAGTYTLSVVDTTSCVNTWSQPLVIDEDPPITVSVDATLSTSLLSCNGADNGKIFLDINGGNPFPGNYYWLFVNDPGFSQQITVDSITGLSAGVYNLSVQDANGCVAQTSYEIFEPDPLSVSHVVTNTLCNSSNDGEVLVIVDGGIPLYSLSNLPSSVTVSVISQDTFKLTGLSEGVYFYDLEDANGCEKLNNSFYVGEPDEVEIIGISSTQESCLGWDASANVSISGGVGSYTILWTYDDAYQLPLQLQNGTLNTSSQTSNPQNLTEGLIYVHVWDMNSCYTKDSIYITQTNSPTLVLLGTVNNLCYGDTDGQISLNATGGTPFYEFSINGGVSWQNLSTFQNLSEGTYNATVRDSLGCTAELENIEIMAPNPISVSVDAEDVSCTSSSDGSASVITVSGGTANSGSYGFSWQNSQGVNLWPANLSAVNPTVNGLLPGTYQLEVEDDNGCSTVYSPVFIGEPAPVTIDLSILSDYNGVDISCFGYSDAVILANADGGTAPFLFEWFNSTNPNDIRTSISATFDTLSLVPQDTYSITVTDSRGCVAEDNITVNQPEQIIVDFEDVTHIRCEGSHDGQATAIYTGGLGFGNYAVSWRDSDLDVISLIAQASNLSAGDYTATYTDNNGCVGTGQVTINYSELFSINNNEDTTSVSCLGDIDGSFNFNVSGGWLPYTFDWSDPLNQQSATAVGLAPGQWYINVITDANNCVLVDSVYVTSPIDIVDISTYSVTDNDCYENNSGAITVEVVGGTPNYQFQWSGANGTVGTNQNINGLSNGTYNLVVTDLYGCEHTSTYTVDGPDSPLLINSVITTNVSCNGLEDGTASLVGQIVGGTQPYVNVDWGGENPSILAAGDYTVVVTDNNGCTKSSTFEIFQPDAYSVSIDVVNEYCEGQNGSVLVQASGGTPTNTGNYDFSIEPISGISPSFDYQISAASQAEIIIDFPSVNDVADTLFQLTITDENGCEFTQEVEIHPARIFNYNEVLNVCYGDSIALDASLFAEYDLYNWSVSPNQQIFENNSEAGLIVNNSSTVTVEVVDLSSLCSFTDELTIQVLNPVIVANDDIGITRGESLSLSISEGESPYLWSTGETSNTIDVSPLITTNYVAYALDTVTGCIGNDTIRVFVGMNEGFSPNGDGYNDTWEISYLNQYESVKIEIFNRWGASIWESSSPNIFNWDGKYNGNDLPIGTYYYIISFNDDNNKEPLTGPVTIVR
mgnify:CR=1 FL=1